MKQILRLFAVVGVVLLTALISAGSCDKKDPDNTNKNTNTNTNSGSGTTETSILKVTPVATIAKMKDKTIYLKASAFPAAAAGTAAQHFSDYNGTAAANRAKAFDIEVDKATGGMVVVANGDITDAAKVTTPAAGAVKTDATGDKGTHVHVVAGTAVGTLAPGANIFSVFADKTAATTATVDAKKAPFAFSASGGATDTQPILWCVSTITGIAATAAATKLTGGQKTSCYVASVGAVAIGGAANAANATAWFAKTAPFKKEVGVFVAGVRTDDVTLDKIGLTGANDAAYLAAFNDGVNETEMTAIIAAAKKVGEKTHVGSAAYTIKVVNDTDFDAVK